MRNGVENLRKSKNIKDFLSKRNCLLNTEMKNKSIRQNHPKSTLVQIRYDSNNRYYLKLIYYNI